MLFPLLIRTNTLDVQHREVTKLTLITPLHKRALLIIVTVSKKQTFKSKLKRNFASYLQAYPWP